MQTKRSGYSLVEVVVAIFVFTIGGLAVAAGSAVIGRSMNTNSVRERANRAAESRLEILRSECVGATTGSDQAGGVMSTWSVNANESGSAVRETVTYPTPAGIRTNTYEANLLCAR